MATQEKITIRQTRSDIARKPEVRRTLRALGLGRIGKVTTVVSNAATLGMVRVVEHIVEVKKAN